MEYYILADHYFFLLQARMKSRICPEVLSSTDTLQFIREDPLLRPTLQIFFFFTQHFSQNYSPPRGMKYNGNAAVT